MTGQEIHPPWRRAGIRVHRFQRFAQHAAAVRRKHEMRRVIGTAHTGPAHLAPDLVPGGQTRMAAHMWRFGGNAVASLDPGPGIHAKS